MKQLVDRVHIGSRVDFVLLKVVLEILISFGKRKPIYYAVVF